MAIHFRGKHVAFDGKKFDARQERVDYERRAQLRVLGFDEAAINTLLDYEATLVRDHRLIAAILRWNGRGTPPILDCRELFESERASADVACLPAEEMTESAA